MTAQTDNPFRTCAGVLRDLHGRYIRQPHLSPEVLEFLGAIMGLVNDCERAARILDGLDQPDLDAFRRALSRLG